MIDRRYLMLAGMFGLMGLTKQKTDCRSDPELCAEQKAQAGLPKSNDPLWTALRGCKVVLNQKTGLYSLTPTPEVKAMAGKVVRVRGFTLPLDGNDRTSHFLIGVNTPVCFYHPPGQPNEVIEVASVKPVVWSEKPVTIEGVFSLINNGEMGVFFRLDKARVAP